MIGRNSQPHCFCYWLFLGFHPTHRACRLSTVLQIILCLLFPLPLSLGYNIYSELTHLISQRLCPKDGQCHQKYHLKNRSVTSIHNRVVIWSGVIQSTRATKENKAEGDMLKRQARDRHHWVVLRQNLLLQTWL